MKSYKINKTVIKAGGILICTALMAACSGTKEQLTGEDKNEIAIENSVVYGADKSEAVENTNDRNSEVPAVSEKSGEETLYEKFLKNEVTVHIEPDLGYGDLTPGTRVNLKEIAETLVCRHETHQYDYFIRGVQYGYLDCGMDGTPELLVVFEGKFDDEQDREYFIIKEADGELKMVFRMSGYELCSYLFNMNGYLYEFEFGCGDPDRIEHTYIDGDGWRHWIYYEYEEGIFTELSDEDLLGEDLSDEDLNYGRCAYLEFYGINPTETDESKVCTYVYWDEDAEQYDYKNGLGHYFNVEVNKDESIYSEDNVLLALYAKEGIEITPISEIEKMIAETEERLGVTEELKNAPDVILKQLDLTFLE